MQTVSCLMFTDLLLTRWTVTIHWYAGPHTSPRQNPRSATWGLLCADTFSYILRVVVWYKFLTFMYRYCHSNINTSMSFARFLSVKWLCGLFAITWLYIFNTNNMIILRPWIPVKLSKDRTESVWHYNFWTGNTCERQNWSTCKSTVEEFEVRRIEELKSA